jgi:serine-type D-Ala-D-Ala carboxypeptidase (penicillin-binding protein 5/6)
MLMGSRDQIRPRSIPRDEQPERGVMVTRLCCAGRFVLALLILLTAAARADAFETPAKAALLLDLETDQVLFAKNPDEPRPTASLSKLMTAFMVFERLEDGRISLDDTFPVSEKAWRKGGSKMFVEVGSRVRVEDLLRGIIIQSGNDACIVVAEALAGSEEEFARQMTERAHELGLTHTNLKNASGWPDPEHVMSVRDLATLATMLIRRFPEYYEIYSEREFTYNGIRQYSRNPLLHSDPSADGLKTGYTEQAGYGLVASAVRDGRRLLLVLSGLDSARQRGAEGERLLEYGYNQFKNYRLFASGEAVETADVWLGDDTTVPLVLQKDVVVSLTPEGRRDLEVKVIYDGPIPAPVENGAQLAELEIIAPGIEPRRLPLVAGEEVHAANLFGRVSSALGYLLWGPS